MTLISNNLIVSPAIRLEIKNFEDEIKESLGFVGEVKILLAEETPHQFQVVIQAILNGNPIQSVAISKKLNQAFKKSRQIFLTSFRQTQINVRTL